MMAANVSVTAKQTVSVALSSTRVSSIAVIDGYDTLQTARNSAGSKEVPTKMAEPDPC